MNKFILYIIGSFLFFACRSGGNSKENEVIVYCAASLTNVVSEISSEFEKEMQVKIRLNFASSGTLARQIEHGGNASLFISANKKWVDYLNTIKKTFPEYEKQLASNSLVVIAPVSSPLQPFTFDSTSVFYEMFHGRLSVGDPKHVPAGDYAMQAIEMAGLKEELFHRLLPAKDVRSALMVVELGETELGIVYRTDALASEKVKILAEIPDSFYPQISYYLSVLNEKDPSAKLFYAYLSSEKSKGIWLKHGFKIE